MFVMAACLRTCIVVLEWYDTYIGSATAVQDVQFAAGHEEDRRRGKSPTLSPLFLKDAPAETGERLDIIFNVFRERSAVGYRKMFLNRYDLGI